MSLYLVSIYIHTIAAVVWIGGMLFLGLVVVPVAQALQPPGSGTRVIREVGKRFLTIAWVCIGTLFVTGVVNLDHWGYSSADVFTSESMEIEFGKILAIKLTVVFSIVMLSVLHDFVLGPKLVRVMGGAPMTAAPRPVALPPPRPSSAVAFPCWPG